MNFSISSTLLKQKLQQLIKVVPSKNTIEAFANFLFEVGNTIDITASDNGMMVKSVIAPLGIGGQGKFMVNARLFTDIVNSIDAEIIEFKLDDGTMVVKAGKGKFKLSYEDGSDFPVMNVSSEPRFSIQLMPEAIAKAYKALSFTHDDPSVIFGNVLLDVTSPEEVTLVGTSGVTLYKGVANCPNNCEGESVVMSKKFVSFLGQIGSEVTLSADDNNVIVENDLYKVICKAQVGKYPNYKSVLPTSFDMEYSIGKGLLVGAVKRVSLTSMKSNQNLLKFSFRNNQLVVSSCDTDFSTESFECIDTETASELEIGLSSPVYMNAITALVGQDISMLCSGSSKPVILKGDDPGESILLMPMMLNN